MVQWYQPAQPVVLVWAVVAVALVLIGVKPLKQVEVCLEVWVHGSESKSY